MLKRSNVWGGLVLGGGLGLVAIQGALAAPRHPPRVGTLQTRAGLVELNVRTVSDVSAPRELREGLALPVWADVPRGVEPRGDGQPPVNDFAFGARPTAPRWPQPGR